MGIVVDDGNDTGDDNSMFDNSIDGDDYDFSNVNGDSIVGDDDNDTGDDNSMFDNSIDDDVVTAAPNDNDNDDDDSSSSNTPSTVAPGADLGVNNLNYVVTKVHRPSTNAFTTISEEEGSTLLLGGR